MGRETFYTVKPPFVVDQGGLVRNSGRQVDWDNVPESYRQGAQTITVSTTAGSTATAIEVTALAKTIPKDVNLYFTGTGVFARLTANAAQGTTSIPVAAPGTAINSGDTAVHPGTGSKSLPAGKAIAELSSGKIVPRSDAPGSEVCAGFLETNAFEDDVSAALTGYGVIIGGNLYENLLPDADVYGASTGVIAVTYKNELASATNGKATGFAFEQYRDTRS